MIKIKIGRYLARADFLKMTNSHKANGFLVNLRLELDALLNQLFVVLPHSDHHMSLMISF